MATACLNLCFYSLAPSQLDFLDPPPPRALRLARQAIPLGSPHKSWCIRHMDQLFSQEKAVSWNFSSVCSVLSCGEEI